LRGARSAFAQQNTWLVSTKASGATPDGVSNLCTDVQGIILSQLLRNTLEPRRAMYFSSASTELRALLTPAAQHQLRANFVEAKAFCLKVDMQDCKELREATVVEWESKDLYAADMATLAKLGSMLPALRVWPSRGAHKTPTACSGLRRGWSRARYRP
jgi:hypothetical protein